MVKFEFNLVSEKVPSHNESILYISTEIGTFNSISFEPKEATCIYHWVEYIDGDYTGTTAYYTDEDVEYSLGDKVGNYVLEWCLDNGEELSENDLWNNADKIFESFTKHLTP